MKYSVEIQHRDSWSPEDNYSKVKYFDSESEAKEFVAQKNQANKDSYTKTGYVPEHYINYYYRGPLEV